ncbi:phage tail tube protein [Brevibacillus formosus]|uniref:phage tail tube protein n=1 Tax=Brevibacillus formosus TaxID=54913 RepID=UPI0012FDCB5B|nr:phage tail tube protein [Brevibacillus formosus]
MTWNGKEVFEVISVEAKIKPERSSLSFVQVLDKFEKLTGLVGEGNFKVYKVYSRGLKDVVEEWKKGKDPHFNLVIELTDPDALGNETCIISDVWFNEVTIAGFDNEKYLEREFPFGFAPSSVEFEDMIDVE